LIADKGYISSELFNQLYLRGLKFITHRSPVNCIVNILAGLVAYSLQPEESLFIFEQ